MWIQLPPRARLRKACVATCLAPHRRFYVDGRRPAGARFETGSRQLSQASSQPSPTQHKPKPSANPNTTPTSSLFAHSDTKSLHLGPQLTTRHKRYFQLEIEHEVNEGRSRGEVTVLNDDRLFHWLPARMARASGKVAQTMFPCGTAEGT